MIQVRDRSGRILRVLNTSSAEAATWNLGYHPQLGLVSEEAARKRFRQRAQAGLKTNLQWESRFRIHLVGPEELKVEAVSGCEVAPPTGAGKNESTLRSPQRELVIQHFAVCADVDSREPALTPLRESKRLRNQWPLVLIVGLTAIQAVYRISQAVFQPAVSTVSSAPMEVVYFDEEPEAFSLQTESMGGTKAAQYSGSLGFLNVNPTLADASVIKMKTSNGAATGHQGAKLGESLGKGIGGLPGAPLSGRQNLTVGAVQGGRRSGTSTGGFRSLSQSVSLGESQSEGGLDPSVVQATVATYLGDLRHCYESLGLSANAQLEGTVTVQFHINGNGLVDSAAAKRATTGTEAIGQCIVDKMRNWNFPKPQQGRGVKVTYPFILRPVL